MLELEQIESFYPSHLRSFKVNLLREYLQYKILEIIYDSKFGKNMVFMGGTAVHLLHGNPRFSEDLDFDNLNLNESAFRELSRHVQTCLEREGYSIEIKNVLKKTYRSYIRFRKILFNNRLSKHKAENLLMQIDSEPQRFSYKPDRRILNKFDVFLQILAAPPDLLLAQKMVCLFKRPRPMGRDFHDIVFLMGKTKPNLAYIKAKLAIENAAELKSAILKHCQKLDLKRLAKDAAPFLFYPDDQKKILLFEAYIRSYSF
ncbi:MAG: hypothetical protein COV74_06170 [Candidatus Omnitrophica bacterium CG11_big_fil_rev_8_21_14_0_20_45_26]|uniref:Nucleotidyl transferase AbiEii/AbiGii toxin family protein n=1 Tax=Candidatus Abzuiibacterium crystallinum TaxID=1974748 RepID=A0A2H0LNU8_9BACT|nr:MAG: hypothetical protein COV74_06170 [Candidatus Omnitrophica bacterium CG11_big_fil_rev_8_21_14_0_20_45_26]PIW65449.1 MAG: hypothetical protein COW12_01835 [Candidatus Omnitrophica bacterium CG12_big_fil_rev_8_21_14_0_65_45_16]